MTRIYINRPAIESNAHKLTSELPVVRVDRDGVIEDTFSVEIDGRSRVVYSPQVTHDGAHVWIETDAEVRAI